MNKITIFGIGIIGLLLASCGGSQSQEQSSGQGVTFAPKERESKMSDEERHAAIAKRKEALKVNIESMMNSTGVKLTVLPPSPNGDITEAISEQIGSKMLTIIAANGIGGVNNVPDFALAATMTETGRQTTGTAPQKFIVKYDINYQVMNMLDGTVFASSSESVTGVGNNFEEATRNAVNEIKSTTALQSMLATGSERIITWFDNNLPTLKNQVSGAVNENNYALALAYLKSVPSQATAAYEYAAAEYPKVLETYKKHNAAVNFAALKAAISAGEQACELNQEVYTAIAMIPEGTPEYAQAQKLVENFQTSVLKRQAEAQDRQYKKEEAERIQKEKMELAKLDADRQIAIAEARASEQAMRLHMREKDDAKRGFWGNLGARIISGMDYIGDKVSGNID